MNPEMSKVIQQMADKLGVTAQHLWEVLVRGNRIEGAICAVFLIAGAIVAYLGYKSVRHALGHREQNSSDGFMVGGVLLLLLGVGSSIGFFYWAVMDTFCPEYGALADILSHLGK